MSNLITPTIPPEIASVFTELGVADDEAEVKSVLMAGALMSYDNEMMPSDNVYLAEVGKNLISSDIAVSQDIVARVANLSLGTDLFDLGAEEQFDWVVFCDWLVAPQLLNPLLVSRFTGGLAIGEATHQSEKTFKANSWTEAFRRAGVKGLTIVGHDQGFDHLRRIALNNNEGIDLLGDEYSFKDHPYLLRAQNYNFSLRAA